MDSDSNKLISVSTSFTQAMGGGGTFEGIPLNLQNPSSDASTGSFKIGHYVERMYFYI